MNDRLCLFLDQLFGNAAGKPSKRGHAAYERWNFIEISIVTSYASVLIPSRCIRRAIKQLLLQSNEGDRCHFWHVKLTSGRLEGILWHIFTWYSQRQWPESASIFGDIFPARKFINWKIQFLIDQSQQTYNICDIPTSDFHARLPLVSIATGTDLITWSL